MTTKHQEPRELVGLGRVAQALADSTSIAEVTAIRDTAEAARVYAQSARLGLELQNQAAEIRLRAERKAGSMLGRLALRGGNRRKNHGVDGNSKYPGGTLKLRDLGITKKQSSRWQRLAAIPDDRFGRYVAATNQLGEEITAAGLLRLHRQVGKRGSPAGWPNRGKSGQVKVKAAIPGKGRQNASPWASEAIVGDTDCGMQCLFCRPATVHEVVEIVGELKDHRAMLAELLQQDSSENLGSCPKPNGRMVRRYLSEIAGLLEHLEQMLAVDH